MSNYNLFTIEREEKYWLTPPAIYQKLDNEFHFDFDPCPYPRPTGYNAMNVDWGGSNFVNPPFHRYNGVGPTAQYLKDKSTSRETMHEEYTFKQQYPELYEKAIQNPLIKVLFKFIANNGEYCDHFTIEPTLGKINFPTFSKEKEDNQNVIRKILEFN